MNELMNEYNKINRKVCEISNKLENQIYETLSRALFDNSYYDNDLVPDLKELKGQWVIWRNFSNDEFSFNMKFGNIDYSDLVNINSEMNKIGFQIGCVFANDDTYKDKNGLEITFTKYDEENKKC